MLEQDYIMRQIRQMIAIIMKVVFGIDTADTETIAILDLAKKAKSDWLIEELDSGNIREAILEFRGATENQTKDDLFIGFNFFSHLCSLDDDILAENNISYAEIKDEMRAFFAQYGISDQLFDLIFFE
ncbi:MAG: hypothetical protein J6B75_05345 [Ruminococcus sp.]|nr:hypothetical protein [Ruminococcus sp.]